MLSRFIAERNHTRNNYFPTKVFTNFTLDQGGGKFTRPMVGCKVGLMHIYIMSRET